MKFALYLTLLGLSAYFATSVPINGTEPTTAPAPTSSCNGTAELDGSETQVSEDMGYSDGSNGPPPPSSSSPPPPSSSSPPPPSSSSPPPPGSSGPPPPSSSVPVGSWVYSCTVPGTVALTFDDGPVSRTASVLDQLRDAGMAATFFVNGVNWGDINSEESKALVRRMVAEGHQIASHTWAHPDLSTLERDAVVSQMTFLESALDNIIGFHPTYMRPPYFGANDLTLQTLGELGYHVMHANIDTFDWRNQSPETIGDSIQLFKDGLNAGGSIVLAHDVHQTTVDTLVPAMIDEVRARGLQAVPVGQCLGDPSENWYRT